MSNDAWLLNLARQQDLTPAEISALQRLRDTIQTQLSALNGSPRIYYAGSYAKKTIIKARYDLDIVMYWPQGTTYTLKDIFEAVGTLLKKHWRQVDAKTVSWELPFEGGFHIDVVPGRALDAQYFEANLYRTDTQTSLKTSLKKHIVTVRDSGRIEAIRLMKLWREKRSVPFKKSFLLEMLVILATKNLSSSTLQQQLSASFRYIADNIVSCNISDPANSNNSLSDDLPEATRVKIRNAALAAIDAKTWSEVFS